MGSKEQIVFDVGADFPHWFDAASPDYFGHLRIIRACLYYRPFYDTLRRRSWYGWRRKCIPAAMRAISTTARCADTQTRRISASLITTCQTVAYGGFHLAADNVILQRSVTQLSQQTDWLSCHARCINSWHRDVDETFLQDSRPTLYWMPQYSVQSSPKWPIKCRVGR